MLARLGELLRRTLEREAGHEVPLERELELLDLYLGIERTRFSDRLQVEVDIEPAARVALVPSFVLQPLVENAVGTVSRGCPTAAGSGSPRELRITIWTSRSPTPGRESHQVHRRTKASG